MRSAAGFPETISSSPMASRIESRKRLAAASAHTRYDEMAQSWRRAAAGRGGVFSSTSATGGVSADGGAVSQPLAWMVASEARVDSRRSALVVERSMPAVVVLIAMTWPIPLLEDDRLPARFDWSEIRTHAATRRST